MLNWPQARLCASIDAHSTALPHPLHPPHRIQLTAVRADGSRCCLSVLWGERAALLLSGTVQNQARTQVSIGGGGRAGGSIPLFSCYQWKQRNAIFPATCTTELLYVAVKWSLHNLIGNWCGPPQLLLTYSERSSAKLAVGKVRILCLLYKYELTWESFPIW